MFEKLELTRMAQALASHAGTRMGVIAENVANADTPGYKAKDIGSFAAIWAAEGGGMQFSFDMPLREARDGFEKAYFEFHLAREGDSMTRVAEKTGLERTHLYRKLRQLGVDLTRNKKH